VARGARLRCAACDHRWVPQGEYIDAIGEAIEDPPRDSVPAPVRGMTPETMHADRIAGAADAARSGREAAGITTGTAITRSPAGDFIFPQHSDPGADRADLGSYGSAAIEGAGADPDDIDRRSPMLRSIVAAVVGLALAIAAFGLWAGQIDASRIPVLGPAIAGLAPPPSPFKVTVAGKAMQLPAGGRVLEVTGTITNTGTTTATVPFLKASLAGPNGAVRRWLIPAPVERLGPGQITNFSSIVTGLPGDARTLSVTPGR
jgi:hypothetical protein